MRRLPVYLLLDTSESMIGEGIESMQDGVASMIKTLRKNPYALESAALSIITFDVRANLATPLTDLIAFQVPGLTLRSGGTALGAAFSMLSQRIDLEVKKSTAEAKGDYRPLVFLLTDGDPTDDWKPAYDAFRKKFGKRVLLYSIACGADVDEQLLKDISDAAYRLTAMSDAELAAQLGELFVWLSASIGSASQGAADDQIVSEDAGLPDGIERIGDDVRPANIFPVPRAIFFHTKCSKTRKTAVVRFTLDDSLGFYTESRAWKMPDSFDASTGAEQPAVPIDLLVAPFPSCPHCGNECFIHCADCGTWYCEPKPLPEISTCPACGTSGRIGGFNSGAQISGAAG